MSHPVRGCANYSPLIGFLSLTTESAKATPQGSANTRMSHLKSELIRKFVTAIQPIEASPEMETTAMAPSLPALKPVTAT